MRKSVLGIIALTALLLGSLHQTARAGEQDFELFNRTGVDIYALYVSPSGTDNWEEDLLGGKVIQNGATVNIQFDGASEAELWDIRVEDSEGNALEFEEINLLEASQVILEEDHTARIK
ncbi:MAG: hypothetical protein AB7S38_21855 [Vulcanimicrobiota bacterium]